ncbi:MAG: MoxR family ATPase [Thermodesulfobacteriota bacterium]|nr:MoxR family ATPase [Thermodesulfobacteriota bacterium]
MTDTITRLEKNIQNVVIGQPRVVREVIITLLAGGHAIVEGVPGLGKTLLVRSIAASVNAVFKRIQFTPDLMPSDISGHEMFELKTNTFKVRRGPVFTNFLLADEINRAPAKTQSALLEVMQEHQVTIEGKSYKLPGPFLVLATQNPIEQEGTYALPQAQLDRFLLKIFMTYPEASAEETIVRFVTGKSVGDKLDISGIEPILDRDDIFALQQYTAGLETDDAIIAYAVRIVQATREWNGIEIGAGPRGSIALLRAARGNAVLSGNTFVTPDDVKAVAPAVLRHRLSLSTDLEIEGYVPDNVLNDILKTVEAPRL